MKKVLVYEILNSIKKNPALFRKIKLFVIIGSFGVLLTGGLLVWVAVSSIGLVASKMNEVVQSPVARTQIESFKEQAAGVSKLQVLNCWTKAQSLFAVEPWLVRTAAENFRSLKLACLEQNPAICEGHGCKELKQIVNTAEGSLI